MSYHHDRDQGFYDQLSAIFGDHYRAISDNSLDRRIGSESADYVIQRIRDDYITGSSCTVVLCGWDTPWRKYVDWEIKATLDKEHGIVGIALPTIRPGDPGKVIVPDRLYDNIVTGYVYWIPWSELYRGPEYLKAIINVACGRSKLLINNTRPLMARNGTPPSVPLPLLASTIFGRKL